MRAVDNPNSLASSSNTKANSRALSVAMIATPKSEYMEYLCGALDELNDQLSLTVYTSVSGNMSYARNVKWGWAHNSWIAPFQIFGEILSDCPQIVHFQFEYGIFGHPRLTISIPLLLLFLWIARKKVVTTIHVVIPFTDSRFIAEASPPTFKPPTTLTKIFLVLLYSSIARLCSATIVHGRLFKNQLVDFYNFKRERVHVIPHGLFFREPHLDKEIQALIQIWRDKLGNRNVILCFGSLTPRRGLEYLIKAFSLVVKKHPEVLLVIAGLTNPYYSEYLQKIKWLIQRLNISDSILMTGPVDLESIHVLHNLAGIVVFPYTFSIAASGSLSFAVQHSKPLIASDTGFFSEELQNEVDALLVPPRDVQALAQAMEKLIDNEALSERLSRNLYSKMNERTWEKVAEMTANVYYKTAGNRASAWQRV